jgi:hypothetical protein
MFYQEYISAKSINQQLHVFGDKKETAGLLKHDPSEELNPNHAPGDSLLFIFSFCIVIKRKSLSFIPHFSFPFYPQDHFPVFSDVYCYQPCSLVSKNSLFSFESSLSHGLVKLLLKI